MPTYFGDRTYAQHGDDLVLACLFYQLGLEQPSYLDLGAYHPTNCSNTALFYERGSRGINVEANPKLLRAFRKQRPEDTNLNLGVGAAPGRALLHLWEPGGAGTFRPDWTAQFGWELTGTTYEVEIRTVAQILDQHHGGRFPDFLNIDIEGMDEEVLESLDFYHSAPSIISAEAVLHSEEARRIRALLEGKGFAFLLRCVNNCIFVRNDLRERLF